MGKENDKKAPKNGGSVITVRTGSTIKNKIDDLAKQENLKPADISRKLINAGLSHLYGLEIEGNELVAADKS